MRRLLLAALVLAACDSPVAPVVEEPQECEAGVAGVPPAARAVIVESTDTHQLVQLVCRLNGYVAPLSFRYRIVVWHQPADSMHVEVPWTEWDDGPFPTLRIDRHPLHRRVLLWDARAPSGEYSTSLMFVEPR